MSFDRESLKGILNYARGMLGLSFLTMLSMQADVFVLGRIISTDILGLYAVAMALAQQLNQLLFGVIGRVMLPAFAAKQDDKQVLCKAVIKTIRTSIIIGAPLVLILGVFSRQILALLYGQKFASMALPFALLCATLLVRMHSCVLASINLATGKPHLHRRYIVLLVLLIASGIYPAVITWGPAGATGILLLSYSIAICMQIVWMKPVIGLGFKDYLMCWIPWAGLLPFSKQNSSPAYTGTEKYSETQSSWKGETL